MGERWWLSGKYKRKKYREQVLAYVEKEDSPRSINYQLDLMKKVGFDRVDILHKNMFFSILWGGVSKTKLMIKLKNILLLSCLLFFPCI